MIIKRFVAVIGIVLICTNISYAGISVGVRFGAGLAMLLTRTVMGMIPYSKQDTSPRTASE